MTPLMKYVYSLAIDGNVFYIGQTKNMVNRYKEHYHKRSGSKVSLYITELFKNGKLPEMHFIAYLPDHEAKKREYQLINTLTRAGHVLMNEACTFTPAWEEYIYPTTKTKQSITAYLLAIQQTKETMHKWHIEERQRQLNKEIILN